MTITLDYKHILRWQVIVFTTLLMLVLYQAAFYFHPANQDWIGSSAFSWGNLLYFLCIDQLLIECITIGIIALGLYFYAHRLNYLSVAPDMKSIVRYCLKFLPLLLVIYFCFAPVTLSVRYLLHLVIRPVTPDYFSHYFFWSSSLYLTYLPLTLMAGWGLLLYTAYKSIIDQRIASKRDERQQYLLVQDIAGEKPLPVQDILWIRREDRKYRIKTLHQNYYVRTPLKELEEHLPSPTFLRINRAVIIRCQQIKSYAYWENDKYVLHSEDGEEFIVSRQRLKKIKHLLNPTEE